MDRFLVLKLIFFHLLVSHSVFGLAQDDDQDDDETATDATKIHLDKNQIPEQFRDLYDSEDDDDDERDDNFCPVCYDDFSEDPPLDLQCGHEFHLDCLLKFKSLSLVKLEKCFICMKELRTKDGEKLGDLLEAKRRNEVMMIKRKIGYLAGYGQKPLVWEELPSRDWNTPQVFNVARELGLSKH